MSRNSNPPDLITYADCVRQNKALLREEKRASKELKKNPEINIAQLASDKLYAKRLNVPFRNLPPEIDKLVKEYLNRHERLNR
jgi:hypothetical protein